MIDTICGIVSRGLSLFDSSCKRRVGGHGEHYRRGSESPATDAATPDHLKSKRKLEDEIFNLPSEKVDRSQCSTGKSI